MTTLGKTDHIRHLRRFAHSHSRTPDFLFLSPEWSSCVRYMTLRKEKLAGRTPKNFALGSCSIFEQIGTHALVHSVNNTDHFTLIINSEFIGPAPDEDATAAAAPNLRQAVAVAAIPEAGPCGFDFDSIPDIARR